MKRLAVLVVLGMVVRAACAAQAGPSTPLARGEPEANLPDSADVSMPASLVAAKLLLRAVVAAGCAVVLVWLMVLIFEKRFVYHPSSDPAVGWEAEHIGARECRFATPDGLKLSAWWHPGARSLRTADGPVVLWCHGNAGNLTHRAENLQLLAARGVAALLFDYRGYGDSEGTPSEQGLYEDADAAYRYLTEERDVEPRRIVCFGRSLGAAVALKTALDHPVAGLVMESAFESVPAMARKLWVFVPIVSLARNRYDNLARAPTLQVPLLMVHGRWDGLVPMDQARRVFGAAPEPKEFYVVEDAAHDDVYSVGGAEYFDRLEEFCRRCVREAAP